MPIVTSTKSLPTLCVKGEGEPGFASSAPLEAAYRHIARYPTSGLPRYGYELDMPGLRAWPVKRHPYPVFYIERDDRIEVWRVKRREHQPFYPLPSWERGKGPYRHTETVHET